MRPVLSSDRHVDGDPAFEPRVAVRAFDGLRTLLVGAVLSVAMQGTATSRLEGQQERRWGGPEIGLNLALGLGRGRFHDFVKAAGGFGAYGTLPIALRGGLALRADLSVLFHDFETWSSFPDITTKSYITTLRAGPQVALSAGRVQLYGFGAGGFSYFATDAEFGSSCDCSFTTTLRDDWTWVTEIGGGMRVALGASRSSLALDLGFRALRNGEATYVTEGGVTQNADGSFTIRPHRTEAHLLVIHLGVSGWVH